MSESDSQRLLESKGLEDYLRSNGWQHASDRKKPTKTSQLFGGDMWLDPKHRNTYHFKDVAYEIQRNRDAGKPDKEKKPSDWARWTPNR